VATAKAFSSKNGRVLQHTNDAKRNIVKNTTPTTVETVSHLARSKNKTHKLALSMSIDEKYFYHSFTSKITRV
jgi:hypothetical protein